MLGGVTMEFDSTKNTLQQGLFILVHGQSGAGKTTLIKTIPNVEEEGLVISAEAGTLPLRKMDIDMVEVKQYSDMDKVMQYLHSDVKYKWVVIDSLTAVANLCLTAQSKGTGSNTKPGWDEYFWFNNKLTDLVKTLRDMHGLHVLLTCLSALNVDDSRGKMMPVIPGRKLRAELPQFFDVVMYLNVDESGNRTLITDCSPHVIAKDRSGVLSNPEVPDLGVIVSKIYGDTIPERKVSPEFLAELEALNKRIVVGEDLVSGKTGEEVGVIRKRLWTVGEYDETDKSVLNAYYHILLGEYEGLNGKDA